MSENMKNYRIGLYLLLTFLLVNKVAIAQLEDPNNDYFFITPPNLEEVFVTGVTPRFGAISNGNYSVWYGCGGAGVLHGNIQKPFIWVEGMKNVK